MKSPHVFCLTSFVAILLICNMAFADTCYDPNYDSYYQCQGDEYIAPVAAAILFGALIAGDNGGGNGYYNHGNHGGYHGGGNHGGYHGGGNHGGHGGGQGRHH